MAAKRLPVPIGCGHGPSNAGRATGNSKRHSSQGNGRWYRSNGLLPQLGFVTIALALLGMLHVDTPSWQLSAYLFLLGVGMGQVMQVVQLAIQNAIPPKEM